VATTPTTLPDALEDLRDALARLDLGLEVPGAADARKRRDEVAGQIEDYLLPACARWTRRC
jgi:hypothetical protein